MATRVAVGAAARFVAAGVVAGAVAMSVVAMSVVAGVAVVAYTVVVVNLESPFEMLKLQITGSSNTLIHLLLWSPHS